MKPLQIHFLKLTVDGLNAGAMRTDQRGIGR